MYQVQLTTPWAGHDIGHLVPHVLLQKAVLDRRSTDQTQETCIRSCRLHRLYGVALARSYRIEKISDLKDLYYGVGIDDLPEVCNMLHY